MKLIEREPYVEVLNSCLDRVVAGRGRIALVSGEAGIGKSALIQQFVEQQRKATCTLWGGCEALFTPHPLAPLYDIARQAGPEFYAAITATGDPRRIFNAAIDQLARVPAPSIVVFEDLHWADEATLDLIKFLGRRLQQLGILFVFSYRDDEVGPSHPLRRVIGDLPADSIRRVPVLPLSEKAVVELAAATGQDAPAQLHAVTGGNAFFVTEALAAADGELPATVRDAVMARIARLPEPARNLVNIASLVPGNAERWLLAETAAADGPTIQQCAAAGMLVQADGSLAFRHELARRAVEECLPPTERLELHRIILHALRRRADVSVARLVHHADGAGDSDTVLQFAEDAAAQASALGAHREAAAHYSTALRHGASLARDKKAELLDCRSLECYLGEQLAEAVAAREAALFLWRKIDNKRKEGDCLRALSRLYWLTGQKVAAEAHACASVEILESLVPGRELAMAYSNLSHLHMLASNKSLTLEWGNKAIALATELGDRATEVHALNNIGSVKLGSGDLSGRADLERSLELALADDLQDDVERALDNLSSNMVILRDFRSAEKYIDHGMAYCVAHNLAITCITALRAEASFALGDWNLAVESALPVIAKTNTWVVTRIDALVVLGRVRARRGDPDSSGPLDEAQRLALPSGELLQIGPVAIARAEAAWLRGDDETAAAEASAGYALADSRDDAWLKGELAFWLWRLGKISSVPDGIATPFALQIAGDWKGAAMAWEKIGCSYEQAMALADSNAEDALRGALAIFDRLGAGPMAASVRRRLRADGIRGIPRGAQERTRRNPQGLTARELKVLALLADGQRNADIARTLFVSDKTVDHHVSAILAKLGVRSRGEAAAAANRFGLLAPENG